MAETLKLPSSTRFSHSAVRSNTQWQRDLAVEKGNRMSLRGTKQHAKDGKITFTQHKGRNRKPKRFTLPILQALQKTIPATAAASVLMMVMA